MPSTKEGRRRKRSNNNNNNKFLGNAGTSLPEYLTEWDNFFAEVIKKSLQRELCTHRSELTTRLMPQLKPVISYTEVTRTVHTKFG